MAARLQGLGASTNRDVQVSLSWRLACGIINPEEGEHTATCVMTKTAYQWTDHTASKLAKLRLTSVLPVVGLRLPGSIGNCPCAVHVRGGYGLN